MPEIPQIIKAVSDAGIIGLLIVFVIGGVRKWWVFGWMYRELEAERDVWKELALKGTKLTGAAIKVAERRRAGAGATKTGDDP